MSSASRSFRTLSKAAVGIPAHCVGGAIAVASCKRLIRLGMSSALKKAWKPWEGFTREGRGGACGFDKMKRRSRGIAARLLDGGRPGLDEHKTNRRFHGEALEKIILT